MHHLHIMRKFVDGLPTRQHFDSLVFVFVPTGVVDQTDVGKYVLRIHGQIFVSLQFCNRLAELVFTHFASLQNDKKVSRNCFCNFAKSFQT